MELRGAQDRVADAARGDELLAGELPAVVDERDPVDPDDRHVEKMGDARAPCGDLQQALGAFDVTAAEAEAGVRCGVQDGIRVPDRVAHGLVARQVAAYRLDAGGKFGRGATGEHPNLVPLLDETCDGRAAERPRAPRDEDAHGPSSQRMFRQSSAG